MSVPQDNLLALFSVI